MEAKMGQRRKSTTNPHQRACIECQKRKTKCVASKNASPACSYCSRAGKRCTFESPPSRTSLTRKNLDAAELRCRQLELIFQSLHPEIDIEMAVQGAAADNSPPSDADDGTPEDFEWNETSLAENSSASKDEVHVRDGMANLPTQSQEAGYLGNTAGSKLLQAISSLIAEDGTWSSPARRRNVRDGREQISGQPSLDTTFSVQSATPAVVDMLVDVYFQSYHPSYPVLHEHIFREKCRNRSTGQPKSSFQITFYMVLAIGHWLSSSEQEHAQMPFYSLARSLFTVQLLEAGTLGTVQALLLMGNYLQKLDRPNTGYNLIGIAYRMALGLGLHREAPTKRNTDILAHERRRQVFWTLYCFDSGFSITTGRPTTISDTFIDARLPRNIDDFDHSMTSTVPAETSHPTPYSAIISQSKLAIIANRMHTSLMSTQISNAEIEPNLTQIRQLVDEWKLGLPPYFDSPDIPEWFRAPRAVVLWKEQNLRILLWQAIERHESLQPNRAEAKFQCSTVALQTVYDITTFCRNSADIVHPGVSWYATYFLFQATMVLLLYELQSAQPASQGIEQYSGSWAQGIDEARRYFTQLETKSNAATRCLAVLDRIQSAGAFPSPAANAVHNFDANTSTNGSYHSLGGHLENSNVLPHSLLSDEASPETAAIFEDCWSTAVDPSLSLFLGNNANHGFFQEFDGFPGTVENNFFDYINFNMYNTGPL